MPAGGATSELRILVAEDNYVNQKVVLSQLHKLGLRADVARNGVEVLLALAAKPYDLVFMDCHMPEMDGYDASQKIRCGVGGQPVVWIVALTANAMHGDRERCLAAGMDDYLAKPVRLEDLRAAVRRCMDAIEGKGDVGCPPGATQPGAMEADGGADAPHLDRSKLEEIRSLGLDPDTDPLVEFACLFLDDAPMRIQEMRTSLGKGDYPVLQRAAHTLKGSSKSIGAERLARISRDVETMSKQGAGADRILPVLQVLDEELGVVSRMLADEIEPELDAAT